MARQSMTQKTARELLNVLESRRDAAKAARDAASAQDDKTVQTLLNGAAERYEFDVDHISRKLVSAVFKAQAGSIDIRKFMEANIHVFPAK